MKKIRPVFKCHGGKFYQCDHIISHFPENYENLHYVEPFCGGASVLLNKPVSIEENINDIDDKIINIMRVIRDQCDEIVEALKKIKYSEETFQIAQNRKEFNNDIDAAINEIILRRMSRGGFKQVYCWSDRQRGGQPGEINAWKTFIKILPDISQRLEKVFIFNKPAIAVLDAFNNKNTLVYVDPPYLPETRTTPDAYDFEMTADQHIELADTLLKFKGNVILSGYPSKLYSRLFKDWKMVKKNMPNHSSQKKVKDIKTEVLFINF